jgi:hypothetical protein
VCNTYAAHTQLRRRASVDFVIKKHRWYLILLTKIKEYRRKSAANIVPDSIYKLLSALQQVIVLEIPITRDVILKVIGKSLVIRKGGELVVCNTVRYGERV